jgi:hypothetical protein
MKTKPFSFVRNARGGFSIVEIALAMLVVGVGLMGVFALFPLGADANRKAIEETQIGIFAEYVLNGFRYEAEEVPWSQVADVPSFRIAPLGSGFIWRNPPEIEAGPGVKTAVYAVERDPTIEEMAFRYEFRVFETVAGRPKVKGFLLNVWPGQYGVLTNGATFYTEVYPYGGI